MKISTKGRYAFRLMINLANKYKEDRYVSLKEISDEEGISLKYLEKIIGLFNKKDYFITSRGVDGGYKLASNPVNYKIGDIIRTAEGDIAPTLCVHDDFKCPNKDKCNRVVLWKELDDVVNTFLDSKTLADYMEKR